MACCHFRICRWFFLLILAVILLSCKKKSTEQLSSPKAGGSPVIRVTGIPDENPTELQRKNAPMVEFLSKSLGVRVKYIPVTDYGAAVQALVAGKIDFAWLGGFTYVQARTMAKVKPLVMRGIDRNFKSVFVTHNKSGIKTMADLKGKSFAFGSKSSTSGHLMPRHFLLTLHKIDPSKDFKGAPIFSGAHDATVKMVESGKVAAGALNQQVWERMVRTKKVDLKKVRILWTTPGFADYVWTTRVAVSPKLRALFVKAFLSLNPKNPKHKVVLQLQGAKKFVKASSHDFDAIEKVAISTGLLQKRPSSKK